jgi:hypothetical protein
VISCILIYVDIQHHLLKQLSSLCFWHLCLELVVWIYFWVHIFYSIVLHFYVNSILSVCLYVNTMLSVFVTMALCYTEP